MTSKVPLTSKQREMFAEKAMEWGNLVFAGLVIAQLVPGTAPFRAGLMVSGLLNFVGAYTIAFYLTKGGDQQE